MFESKTPFESNTFKRAYLFGSVIVWVSILIGTAVVLSGTPYFAQILPILFVGLIWFIVLGREGKRNILCGVCDLIDAWL